MNIPGSAAKHAIITDACRSGKTDMGAFDEAVERLRQSYVDALEGWRDYEGVNYHLILSIERPK